MSPADPVIGVLALQGDVREHLIALAGLGVTARPIRRPSELADLDGIVDPGGRVDHDLPAAGRVRTPRAADCNGWRTGCRRSGRARG